jgi:hypothetical protein
VIDAVEVVDMNGRVVYRIPHFSAESINVSNLIRGIYVLRVIHNKQAVTRKFVKK